MLLRLLGSGGTFLGCRQFHSTKFGGVGHIIETAYAEMVEESLRGAIQQRAAWQIGAAFDFHQTAINELLHHRIHRNTTHGFDPCFGDRLAIGNDSERFQRRLAQALHFFTGIKRATPFGILATGGNSPAVRTLDKGEGMLFCCVPGDQFIQTRSHLFLCRSRQWGNPLRNLDLATFGQWLAGSITNILGRLFDGGTHLRHTQGLLGGKKKGFDDRDQFHGADRQSQASPRGESSRGLALTLTPCPRSHARMALRLSTAVTHGEIDNTSRDNVRGKFWLVGREDPVTIDLRGNAWRDVAGCKITFTNPKPSPQHAAALLKPKQKGRVGDITASRKVEGEDAFNDPSTEEQHVLYVEWFSEENGRVFIEGTDFEVSISAWVWEMDEALEEAQKLSNLHAMREWLAGIILRPEPKEDDDGEFDDSEESWEHSLKQSDRLSDANMEAIEKYGIDGLHDDRIAFVMGWDHMLGGSREHEPDGEDAEGEAWKDGHEVLPELELIENELDDETFSDLLEEEEREAHPLQTMAHEFVLRLLTEIKEECSENAAESDDSTPLDRFIRNSMNISGKLAGALGTHDFGGSFQTGHTLAILRRCLNWANEASAALNELMEAPEWCDRQELLSDFRAELFAIRDGINDLRKKLRAE